MRLRHRRLADEEYFSGHSGEKHGESYLGQGSYSLLGAQLVTTISIGIFSNGTTSKGTTSNGVPSSAHSWLANTAKINPTTQIHLCSTTNTHIHIRISPHTHTHTDRIFILILEL